MKPGVATAVAALGNEAAQAARLAAQQQQAELFAAEDARLDANLPVTPKGAGAVGRPKGSQNRRTALVADYYLRRHGDPVEALLVMGLGSLKDLIRELDEVAALFPGRFTAPTDLLEILKFKKACLAEASRFVRSPMPVQLDVKDERRALLVIGDIRAPAGAPGQGGAGMSILDLSPEEEEQYQRLSEEAEAAADGASHGAASHGEPSD
ncbi:hypothetical protein [Bosea lupini]|uniref:hypothetical protein n=1 Tax=Bosea lupini TaxID=1036779 RepID=UPI00142F4330|nr:hypothetical protein [Bosea lupini]